MNAEIPGRMPDEIKAAAAQWAAVFATAPMSPAHAGSLALSALAVTRTVARAAHELVWSAPDDFIQALRAAERADDL